MTGISPIRTSESSAKLAYSSPKVARRIVNELGEFPDPRARQQNFPAAPPAKLSETVEELSEQKSEQEGEGHSLFQEVFFFCTVMDVGDVRGTGCIYVETVVDRDSGCAFAKVYAAESAINAVDILSSRVFPFFKRSGFSIKEIHTPNKPEYFGLVPLHPFETFLATSHILHLPIEQPGMPYNYLCVQFYRFLQKEFFPPALRKKFHFSMDELQKELDDFMDAYNAMQLKHLAESKNKLSPSPHFPVDL